MKANNPYAIKNQRGARNTPSRGYFCDELVLYGLVGFHARKGPTIGANENAGYISPGGEEGGAQPGVEQARVEDVALGGGDGREGEDQHSQQEDTVRISRHRLGAKHCHH